MADRPELGAGAGDKASTGSGTSSCCASGGEVGGEAGGARSSGEAGAATGTIGGATARALIARAAALIMLPITGFISPDHEAA